MTMNRVQFQPGLSMPEFLRAVRNRSAVPGGTAGGALAARLRLPEVRRRGAHQLRARRPALLAVRRAAPHQCSLISGTIFEASKLPLTRWFLAMQLLTQSKNNVSALELMRQLGVSYRSAWLIKHKIMEAMRLARGAARARRPRRDRRRLPRRRVLGGKAGRGSENKVPIVAAVQTTARGRAGAWPACASSRTPRRRWRCSPPRTSRPRPPWSPTACGASAPPRSSAPTHERVVTGGGKASVELPQFKAVNTLLGNLKTAISGTYHAFDFAKYAHRYLAEFQYRFNRRFNMRPSCVACCSALVAAPAVVRSAACGLLSFLANHVGS